MPAYDQCVPVAVDDLGYKVVRCGAAVQKTGGHNIVKNGIAEIGYGVLQSFKIPTGGVSEQTSEIGSFEEACNAVIMGLRECEHLL